MEDADNSSCVCVSCVNPVSKATPTQEACVAPNLRLGFAEEETTFLVVRHCDVGVLSTCDEHGCRCGT